MCRKTRQMYASEAAINQVKKYGTNVARTTQAGMKAKEQGTKQESTNKVSKKGSKQLSKIYAN